MNNNLDFRTNLCIFWRYLYLSILMISIPEVYIYMIQEQYFKDNISVNVLVYIIDIIYCICAYKYILNRVLLKEYKTIVIKNNLNSITWKIATIYVLMQYIARLLCVIICNLFFDSENNNSVFQGIIIGIHIAIFQIFLEYYLKIEVKRK